MDIWRVVPEKSKGLTTQRRETIKEGVPCRIYTTNDAAIRPKRQAADIEEEMKIACDNAVDIKTGDELFIHRGAVLNKTVDNIRAFAGSIDYYFEPFGAVIPGLAHKEVRLLSLERVD